MSETPAPPSSHPAASLANFSCAPLLLLVSPAQTGVNQPELLTRLRQQLSIPAGRSSTPPPRSVACTRQKRRRPRPLPVRAPVETLCPLSCWDGGGADTRQRGSQDAKKLTLAPSAAVPLLRQLVANTNTVFPNILEA